MKFEEDLIDALINKGLSNSSIKIYIKTLRSLNNGDDLKNLKFLSNSADILDKIKHYKDTTQRNILICIVSVLKVLKKDTLYKKYYDLMIERCNEINEKPKHEKSEKQEKNWMSWDDVLNVYNDLKNNLKFSKNITEEQYNKLLEYVILSLYVYIPPRRNQDYMICALTKKKPTNKDINYIDLKNEQIIFNVYKTSKKDGQLIININDDLNNVLKLYLRYHPLKKLLAVQDIPFLVNYDGKPLLNDNSITRILNKIFKKNIGSSMLRHIYLSSKYKNVIKEQEKDSKLMSHNLLTQKDYIKI